MSRLSWSDMAPSVHTSPATSNSNGCWPSPTPSQLSTSGTKRQYINTSVPLTVTPATAFTPNGTSSTASPSTVSLQSSPEGPRGRNPPLDFSPSPLQLPETTISTPPLPQHFHGAMSEAIAASKTSGLIRRLSRGAANKIRRRQSSNHLSDRDRSSGPVMLRHRSNSKNDVDLDAGAVDHDFEADIEDVQEDPEPVQGLGLASGDLSGLSLDDASSRHKPSLTQGGIAPIVPMVLRRGTPLTKVTKGKKKRMTFVLNTDSAKVSWHPENTSKQFYVDDIQQIRLQGDARNYREECGIPLDSESRWFTIIYADQNRTKGRSVKTMHLMASNQVTFELWTSTLDDLQKYRHKLMTGVAGSRLNEKTLKGHWKCEMAKLFEGRDHKEYEENLDFIGVENLCHSFHIHCSKNMLRAQFEKADANGTGYLDFLEFKDFIRRLKLRNDIKDIYRSINPNPNDGITLNDFLQFLSHTQGISVQNNRSHWVKVFNKHIRQANKSPTPPDAAEYSTVQMNFPAFSAFLCSDDNNVQNFKVSEVKFDRPMNEYFISSSHNTYLMGKQYVGSSSTEAYIRALQSGCRCVEIDCWDGPDGRPIVLHGRTLTSSVLFGDCVSVIGKYAFEASPYPLILSLEVHCKPAQQQEMVNIMISELGDQLLLEPLMTNAFQLPSPEDLRNKILIKVKSSGEDPNSKLDIPASRFDTPSGHRNRSLSSPCSRPQILDNQVIPSTTLMPSPSSTSPIEQSSVWAVSRGSMTTTSISSATEDSEVSKRNDAFQPKKRPTKKRTSKIIQNLGKLGVYTQGITFTSFTLPESKALNHVFSIAERGFESLCQNQDSKAQLEKHNMRYLMRVYPAYHRINSSNPDPLIFWRRGVQMMALNWQTYDLPMQMNEAMFASGSDKLGYVLKPRELRESTSIQEEISEPSIHGLGRIQKKKISFSVEVISAQQLPRPRGIAPDATLDPYIEIEMFCAEDKSKDVVSGEGGQDASARNGMSGIGSPHRRRTKVVQANGFNPVFQDEFRLTVETKYPSLVFVRWTVWNSQDGRQPVTNASTEPLATFTAKLSSLEQGYRHLRLYDHNGDQFNCATLFCKIKKEEPETIDKADPVPERGGLFKRNFGKTFKRTVSVEKRNGGQNERKASTINMSKSTSTSGEKLSEEA